MEVEINQNDSKSCDDVDDFVPWDNPDNVITFETLSAVETVLICYFNPLVFFIGIPANVLNCVVFLRQGSYTLLRSHQYHRHHHHRRRRRHHRRR